MKAPYSSEHNAVNAIFQLVPRHWRSQKQYIWHVGNCSRGDGDDHTLVVSACSYCVWLIRDPMLWSCLCRVFKLPAKRLLTTPFCISILYSVPTSLLPTYTQHFLTPFPPVCLTCNLSVSELIPSAISSDEMAIGNMIGLGVTIFQVLQYVRSGFSEVRIRWADNLQQRPLWHFNKPPALHGR